MSNDEIDGVDRFYDWSRDYWIDLSTDPENGWAGLLNFGCWDNGSANLHQAQLRLFEICTEFLRPSTLGAVGLEIGCGPGGNAIKFCEQESVYMTALDVSSGQLELAKKRALASHCRPRVQFVYGNSMDMPFSDDSFDFSFCVESSFHYSRLGNFIAEQARVLRPGAKAVIADITCEDNSKVRFKQGNHFYSTSRMKGLLAANSLELVAVRSIGIHVFEQLYEHAFAFSSGKKSSLSKYWNLVLSNYLSLFRTGLMDYHVFEIRKVIPKNI